MKEVRFEAKAAKQLAKLPADVRRQIGDKLKRYAETGAGKTKVLVGQQGSRIRAGNYRAIFDETATEIIVVKIGDRRDVYD